MQKNHNTPHVIKNHPVAALEKHIDWSFFFIQWDLAGRYPQIFEHPTKGAEAKRLYNDAQKMLRTLDVSVNAVYQTMFATRSVDDIILDVCDCCLNKVRIPMLRNQTTHFGSLVDFVTTEHNQVTAFALSVHNHSAFEDDYLQMMSQILCDRLADAMSSHISEVVEKATGKMSLSVGLGYPASPDHSPKRTIVNLLNAEKNIGMMLTENYSMSPTSSVCGLIFSNPEATYINVGIIGDDQVRDYSLRAGITEEELRRLIPNNLLAK